MTIQDKLKSEELTRKYKGILVKYENKRLVIQKVERIENEYWTTFETGVCINWHPSDNITPYEESDLVPNPK